MAGLMFSDIIIRDKATRERFIERDKTGGFINPLSVAGHQAAYEQCGPWLEQLKEYLDGNFDFLESFLKENMPEAVFCKPDATYLAWVNLQPCMPGVEDMCDYFANEARRSSRGWQWALRRQCPGLCTPKPSYASQHH